MLVQKKARQVRAWCLGEDTEMERLLIAQGRISREGDGSYRVRSQENGTEGQVVPAGDYFKVDSTGAPYPNSREFFLANHTHIAGDLFLQTSPVLKAWCREAPMCPEVELLLGSGRLRIDEKDPCHYFRAFLWGAWLHAAADGVIIFDRTEQLDGKLLDVEFHFITREEFLLTYQIVEA